jgi:hypothetical protein
MNEPERNPGVKSAEEERPWELPGGLRRDCEPHRGDQLRVIGLTSYVCGLLSLVLVFPGVIGVLLGIVVWGVARRDLSRMRAGFMDPGGKRPASFAAKCAVAGVVLSLLSAVCFGTLWLVFEDCRSGDSAAGAQAGRLLLLLVLMYLGLLVNAAVFSLPLLAR